MDTSPELVNPTGKFKIGSVEAKLALNYARAGDNWGNERWKKSFPNSQILPPDCL